jgi:hypothetical protein
MCLACDRATVQPFTVHFESGCKECGARSLAQSPAFFDSERSGTMTRPYRVGLGYVFGPDWQAGHAKVREWAVKLAAVDRKEAKA